MKKRICIISLMLLTAISITAHEKDFPKLTGPYLGQTPPGLTPEILRRGLYRPIFIITVHPAFLRMAEKSIGPWRLWMQCDKSIFQNGKMTVGQRRRIWEMNSQKRPVPMYRPMGNTCFSSKWDRAIMMCIGWMRKS